MSVFVDIAPDEPQVGSPAVVASAGKWRGRITRAALPLLSVVVFFIVWQLVAASGIWNQTFVPYPSTVWQAFLDVSTTHDGVRGYAGYLLSEHLYMTLRRVLAGVVIGVALGVLLGLVMGSVSWVRSVLEPWLTFLRALPPLAYFFLLVIWLGIDEAPKITLLALAALPPAAVATTAAVVAAPVGLQEAARALGASRSEVIRDVVVPSALPETFTGIRLAVGMAYSSVVAAELFNGIPGIGGLVKDASNYNNTPVVLVGIFAIGISGLIIDGLLRAIERRAVPWRGKLMRFKAVFAALALASTALAGCAVEQSGQQADRPTIRVGYQTFPSGDLIVKNNRWLEEALPDYNIKWTKFDSGADVNTAFIAKELDFGALGSSPVARGLSAPLNIPYKVAFVLDVAGDNEALVARNGAASTPSRSCGASGSPHRSPRRRTTACWPRCRRMGCPPAMFSWSICSHRRSWPHGTAVTSTPPTRGCRRWTTCARAARI